MMLMQTWLVKNYRSCLWLRKANFNRHRIVDGPNKPFSFDLLCSCFVFSFRNGSIVTVMHLRLPMCSTIGYHRIFSAQAKCMMKKRLSQERSK